MLRQGESIEFRPHRICFINTSKSTFPEIPGIDLWSCTASLYLQAGAEILEVPPVVIGISCQPVIVGKTFGVQYMIIPVSVAVDAKRYPPLRITRRKAFTILVMEAEPRAR